MQFNMLYKMYEWEKNGSYDSDWYAIIYDSEKNKLFIKQTGTTSFADSLPNDVIYENSNNEWVKIKLFKPDENIINLAWKCLVEAKFNYLKNNYIYKLNNFSLEEFGVNKDVYLRESHKNKDKETLACIKCNGSGLWNNKGKCFSCNGIGFLFKNKNNKWKFIEAGTKGKILEISRWGSFYSNGYKKPNLSNSIAKIKLDNGDIFNVPLKKLGIERKYYSDEELKSIAEDTPKELRSFQSFYLYTS